MILVLTQWEVQKLLLFTQKQEREDSTPPPLPQTAVPLPEGPSWSGTNVAKLLWPKGSLL